MFEFSTKSSDMNNIASGFKIGYKELFDQRKYLLTLTLVLIVQSPQNHTM